MTSFSLLIDFLEKRIRTINHEFNESNKVIVNHKFNESDLQSELSFIESENIKLYVRQNKVNSIIIELWQIAKIIRNSKQNSSAVLEKKFEEYLNMEVNKIIKEKVAYDQNYPLFGFSPINKKLIHHYKNNEEFEKCIEIQSGFNTKIE